METLDVMRRLLCVIGVESTPMVTTCMIGTVYEKHGLRRFPEGCPDDAVVRDVTWDGGNGISFEIGLKVFTGSLEDFPSDIRHPSSLTTCVLQSKHDLANGGVRLEFEASGVLFSMTHTPSD